MRFAARVAWLLTVVGPAVIGCSGNPFLWSQHAAAWQQQQPQQQSSLAQLQELHRRASQLDADNRDLHLQLAQSQQQVKLLRDQMALLQKRLVETANQLRDIQLGQQNVQLADQAAEKQVDGVQASSRQRAGATITANNSVRQSLQVVDVPGLEVRQEDDVIRIELPADHLFRPGSAQLQPGSQEILDHVAGAITRNYPRQMLGVEGHTDSAPPPGGSVNHHQLSAFQAMAVFEQLTRRNRLPARQLFIIAHGANHPRVSNGTPAGRAKNRRIELVIYPETLD